MSDLYIGGLVNGYKWANYSLRQREAQRLYCEPDNLSLTIETYRKMITDELDRMQKNMSDSGLSFDPAKEDDIEVDLILLQQLEKVFPC
ncbi:MAG: hypothetical protein KDI51_09950 [Xanthomonadales bacterium]|nr:hypothetical protein [Xanthomonadales bacterium]